MDELLKSYKINQRGSYRHPPPPPSWIGSSFSSWYDIITGILQVSILGPLLLNIFINNLLFLQIKSEICNFADDNTLYSCNKELGTIILNLEYDMTNILSWFRYEIVKTNPGKFQFVILQKQPPRGVLKKRCSENMQQIYRRTPMPKCGFNKVPKQLS